MKTTSWPTKGLVLLAVNDVDVSTNLTFMNTPLAVEPESGAEATSSAKTSGVCAVVKVCRRVATPSALVTADPKVVKIEDDELARALKSTRKPESWDV